MEQSVEKPWSRRMAEQLQKCNGRDYTPEIFEAILEAAGELKTVRLKVLLGRCYEILNSATEADAAPIMGDKFLAEVLQEIQ